MRIRLSTRVRGNPPELIQKFDQSLFERLSPPGAKVELLRFDGSREGDRVHVRLYLPLLGAQDWVSEIVADWSDEDEAGFVDEGIKLPFFLAKWQHRHIVRRIDATHSEIVDDIRYAGPWWLPAPLTYPVMWAQFAYRRPIYRKVFGT